MKRILVVDDSRTSIRIATKVIHGISPEIEVISAQSGDEAIELARNLENPPEAALIDFNMPGMDGIECGGQLIPILPDCKMILVTANIQSTIQERATEAGMSFVGKPLSKGKLAEAL
ncbi:MAG: response regulator [bacterium]|nr:response regulator [bacterium]MCP5067700.1 response regulator [bacterium]